MWSQSQIPRMCSDWANKWSWFWPFVHATPLLPFFFTFIRWTLDMRVFIIVIFICLPLSVNITFYFTQSQKSYFKGPCCCILSVSSHSSTGSLCQGWAFTVSVSSSYTFTLWPDHGAISLHIRPEEKSLLVHTCHKDICCFQQSSSVTAAIVCWTSPCESLTCKSVSRFGF